MSDPNTQSVSEQAYLRLLDKLKEAAGAVTGPIGAINARERAEGFRHLTRLLSVWLENILEKGDRTRPVFTRWINPYRKLLGDNPGTIYDSALIDPALIYRIAGRRGSPTYLGFCVYGTAEDGRRSIVSNIDDSEMQFEQDGSFELLISKDRPDGAVNWVGLAPEATDVFVRQYFLRAEQQEAVYEIEAVPRPPVPPPLTEEELSSRLDTVGSFVLDTVMVETTISALSRQSTSAQLRQGAGYDEVEGEASVVDMSWVMKAMPSPSIVYTGKWIDDLAEDEVLIIEGRPPEARYWSIQLQNRFMESPDYRYHQVIFTQANTKLEADGSFRVVIAHRDPGAANWLDTTGITCGNIAMRAIGSRDQVLDVTFRRERIPHP
jgi:hypothetical protein